MNSFTFNHHGWSNLYSIEDISEVKIMKSSAVGKTTFPVLDGISEGVALVAIETYSPSQKITLKEYAQHLQSMHDEWQNEQELNRVKTFMKGKWFLM